MKDKKIIDNKIGMQIAVLIVGAVVLSMGVLEAVYSDYNYINLSSMLASSWSSTYNINGYIGSTSSLWIGICVAFLGALMIIVASIKIANLCLLKKQISNSECMSYQNAEKYRNFAPKDNNADNNMQTLREEIMFAQNMLKDELLTQEEYETMRKTLLEKMKV